MALHLHGGLAVVVRATLNGSCSSVSRWSTCEPRPPTTGWGGLSESGERRSGEDKTDSPKAMLDPPKRFPETAHATTRTVTGAVRDKLGLLHRH